MDFGILEKLRPKYFLTIQKLRVVDMEIQFFEQVILIQQKKHVYLKKFYPGNTDAPKMVIQI